LARDLKELRRVIQAGVDWRIEEPALQLGAGSRDDARADLPALQGVCDRMQERITQIGMQRTGRREDGVKLAVGERKRLIGRLR